MLYLIKQNKGNSEQVDTEKLNYKHKLYSANMKKQTALKARTTVRPYQMCGRQGLYSFFIIIVILLSSSLRVIVFSGLLFS